jgi:hypothetical protein
LSLFCPCRVRVRELSESCSHVRLVS